MHDTNFTVVCVHLLGKKPKFFFKGGGVTYMGTLFVPYLI